MKLLILGLTGKRGSGKDTVAEYLHDKCGFHVLTYTDDVLGPLLKKQGKEVERNNLIDLALKLREEQGKDILTKMIAEKVGKEGLWAISGVRYPEEDEYFRKFFGENYRLVNVSCDAEKRYERVVKRGTKGEGGMTLEQFKDIENRETEKVINETVELADFSIENNGSLEELRESIGNIAEKIGFSKSP